MSGEPILELVGAGKSYRTYPSAWWRAAGWITGRPTHFTDNWVLRDVTWSVRPGEAIGIVGRNGAGKSTLLKLVAGTLVPTQGRVTVRGRISAILELGMGFNHEFTARENVYHACGLQGYPRARIDELLPWIEEFADVGSYFDEPLRTFSSGMTMRVAFAVATATRPDVLIVDEALSVGDASFQRKSFRRIEEFLASGTTLLFVSHGTESVKRICDRAIWIANGRVMSDGPSKEVVEAYERDILGAKPLAPANPVGELAGFMDQTLLSDAEQQYGSRGAEIFDVVILDEASSYANTLPERCDFAVTYRVRFDEDCKYVQFGMMIKTVDGICVYATNTAGAVDEEHFRAGEVAEVRFDLCNALLPGVYFLNCGVNHRTDNDQPFLHRRIDVAVLRVVAHSSAAISAGLTNLQARCHVQRAADLGSSDAKMKVFR